MNIITLTEAKAHLRIDGTDEDLILTVYIGAAEKSASNFMNRNIYASSIGSDVDGIVMDDVIKAACLLILGHLFSNREDVVSGGSVSELPHGSKALLYPYRISVGM